MDFSFCFFTGPEARPVERRDPQWPIDDARRTNPPGVTPAFLRAENESRPPERRRLSCWSLEGLGSAGCFHSLGARIQVCCPRLRHCGGPWFQPLEQVIHDAAQNGRAPKKLEGTTGVHKIKRWWRNACRALCGLRLAFPRAEMAGFAIFF